MTKLITTLIITLFATQGLLAQNIDLGEKPEPLEKKEFEFPDYKKVVLENGLTLFLVEDHEQPTLSFNMLFAGGEVLEQKQDVASFTTAMMTKGTKNMTAQDIAAKLDGVGAGISANTSMEYNTVSGSALYKHKDLLFNTLVEIIMNPTFPEDELAKLKPQFIASIKEMKSSPGSLASAMAKKVVFGEDHPYAKVATEESINAVEREDILEYYQKFFLPNNATMTIIGDFDTDDMVSEIKALFANWEKGKNINLFVKDTEPMPKGVYFVERPGSVQSSVRFVNPTVPYTDDNYLPIDVATDVLTSSFAGRMFKTIREKYSYTYSPTGFQSSYRRFNYFYVGSDVRNDVTDSTIMVMADEVIGDLAMNGPKKDELELIKSYNTGQFFLSFESSNFIASLIQSFYFKGKPLRTIEEYPNEYKSVSAIEVQKAAQKYLNPSEAFIIVVGDPEVKKSLEKFGNVYSYNTDLEPATALAEADIDGEELLEMYIEAIGGKSNIESVKTLRSESEMELIASGQTIKGSMTVMQEKPDKSLRKIDMNVFKSTEYLSGDEGWEVSSNGKIKKSGKDLEDFKFSMAMFNHARLAEFGYSLKVKGKKDGIIVADLMNGEEKVKEMHFDAETGLLMKTSKVENTPRGQMVVNVSYKDYKKFGNVMLPTTIENNPGMFTMTAKNIDYKINAGDIDDATFKYSIDAKEGNNKQ